MKRFFLYILLLFPTIVFGQQKDGIIDKKLIEDSAKVYDVVEQMPSFPGGSSALFEYLANNIIYPADAENNGIQGRVVCTFVVEKDGSITHICVASSVFSSLDEEAIRVIANMPKWIPGRQNGSTVRVKYTVPVTFRLH